MSRTYRNLYPGQKDHLASDREWELRKEISYVGRTGCYVYPPVAPLTPTKEEIARARRDGGTWYSGYQKHYYWNKNRRIIRRVERELNQEALRAIDIEDFDYDTSEGDARYKGTPWDIW